jgi:uncharacterized lipoprotein YajG
MDILLRKVMKKMIKKILIISSLVIALTLTGCSPSGVLRTVTPLPLAATNTADTDNIQDESLNGLDDSQEIVKVEEADGEFEANESATEQELGENLSNGGHQDLDNTDVVDHQFEGVE